MIHGNLALVIQVLTLIVAIERAAVYVVKAWKSKGSK